MCLRSDAFAMLPSCTEEGGILLQAVSAEGALQVSTRLSQELSCGCLGRSESSPVICVWPEENVFSEICLFLFAFFPPFSSFFSLMEVKPLGATPLLQRIASSYWKSSFRAREWLLAGPLTSGIIKHIASLFAFVLVPLRALSAHSRGSAGPRLLPAVVLAGWAGDSAAAPPAQHTRTCQLGTQHSGHWELLLSTAPVPLLGHFGGL